MGNFFSCMTFHETLMASPWPLWGSLGEVSSWESHGCAWQSHGATMFLTGGQFVRFWRNLTSTRTALPLSSWQLDGLSWHLRVGNMLLLMVTFLGPSFRWKGLPSQPPSYSSDGDLASIYWFPNEHEQKLLLNNRKSFLHQLLRCSELRWRCILRVTFFLA